MIYVRCLNYLSYCWTFQGFITFMMPGEMSYLTYWCLKSDFPYNILNFPSINKIVPQDSLNNWKHILPFLVVDKFSTHRSYDIAQI